MSLEARASKLPAQRPHPSRPNPISNILVSELYLYCISVFITYESEREAFSVREFSMDLTTAVHHVYDFPSLFKNMYIKRESPGNGQKNPQESLIFTSEIRPD